MGNDVRTQFYNNLNLEETEKLLEIWQSENSDAWDEMIFEIIEEILVKRAISVPPRSITFQATQIIKNVDRYFQAGELGKALSDCNLSIQLKPDLAIAYYYRGQIYDEMQQPEKAISNYQTAIQLDPELNDAWENLLSIEKEIEEIFKNSVVKQHLDLAFDYAQENEPEKALLECESVREELPGIASAHNYFGMILEEAGQLELAIEAYIKATKLNPHFYPARKNLENGRSRLLKEIRCQFAEMPLSEDWEENGSFTNSGEIEVSGVFGDGLTAPEWLYLDEKALVLVGWGGHRTRPSRSGYDPLESDFELAHMQGVMLRSLLTLKFRTHNPFYMLFMAIVGLIFCLPLFFGGAIILEGEWDVILFQLFIYSPYWVAGVALLVNLLYSLCSEKPATCEENGYAFF